MALIGRLERARANGSAPLAVALLIAANLVPLAGVLFFGWNILTVLALYWVENGIVGAFNVARIYRSVGTDEKGGPQTGQNSRTYLAPFFVVHYGLFWVVHGIFVFAIAAFAPSGGAAIYEQFAPAGVVLGAVVLAISHGASYVRNFIGGGEYRRVSPRSQFWQPYPRLLVLHITILGGALLLITFDQPVLLVALLVVLKTVIDLALHLREHSRLRATRAAAGG